MDTYQRTAIYIDSLDTGNNDFLNEIEKYAHENDVPVIRHPVQNLLKVLLSMNRPDSILEVGTAIGFSTLLMAEYGPENCHITTIEKYEKRFPLAENNFEKSGYKDRITFIKDDADNVLTKLCESSEKYDFIFMDAAKGQYINFLDRVKKLMPEGGILVSDNALQDDELIQSKYAVARRNRTIHKRMREYLYALTHDDELITTVLPVGDGITISVKR